MNTDPRFGLDGWTIPQAVANWASRVIKDFRHAATLDPLPHLPDDLAAEGLEIAETLGIEPLELTEFVVRMALAVIEHDKGDITEAKAKFNSALTYAVATGDKLARFTAQVDYAPGVTDRLARALRGADLQFDKPLVGTTRAIWMGDVEATRRGIMAGTYAKSDGTTLLAKIATFDPLMRTQLAEELTQRGATDSLKQFTTALAGIDALRRGSHGVAHLIAVEQQLLAYRVNDSIEHKVPGLPGALQPATVAALRQATPYCWSADCVEAAAAGGAALLPATASNPEALGPVAGPNACGWWWFNQPVPVQTLKTSQPVVALLWRREHHERPGAWNAGMTRDEHVTWFSCFVHEPMRVNGREQIVAIPTVAWNWFDGERLETMLARGLATHREHVRKGIYGDEASGEDVTLHAIEWFSRFWLAGGLWMQQRILGSTKTALPRQPGRQLAREHRLTETPLVEVVHLRRREQPKDLVPNTTPSGRVYTHQWVVNGFWRNQFYPSSGRHNPKWIESFVKGPAGTPLVTKTKVYAVDR